MINDRRYQQPDGGIENDVHQSERVPGVAGDRERRLNDPEVENVRDFLETRIVLPEQRTFLVELPSRKIRILV